MGGEKLHYMGANQCYSEACNEHDDEKRLELLKQVPLFLRNKTHKEYWSLRSYSILEMFRKYCGDRFTKKYYGDSYYKDAELWAKASVSDGTKTIKNQNYGDVFTKTIAAQSQAVKAYGSEPNDTDVLSLLCTLTNALVEECPSMKEKAEYGHELKEYLDKAVDVSPYNCEFLDMRGRFAYKFSTMGNMEGLSAAGFPDISLNQALEDFLTLDKLIPNVTENNLFIGKIYDAMEDYANAKTYLNKVLEMSTDPECELAMEANQILSRSDYASDDDDDEQKDHEHNEKDE